MLKYFFAIFFYFLHIQTDSDKYRIRSRYDKHHIYGSYGRVFAYTFVQIYWQKPVFFTFLPCSLVIKTDQQKFKVVSFIGWYDSDCGKSNTKRHIRMCLRDQSVTKKLLQLLGRPHRSFSVVQINYPPTCRKETLYFTL